MCHMVHRRRPTWFFLPHWCIMCRRKGDRADHIFVQSLVILSPEEFVLQDGRAECFQVAVCC